MRFWLRRVRLSPPPPWPLEVGAKESCRPAALPRPPAAPMMLARPREPELPLDRLRLSPPPDAKAICPAAASRPTSAAAEMLVRRPMRPCPSAGLRRAAAVSMEPGGPRSPPLRAKMDRRDWNFLCRSPVLRPRARSLLRVSPPCSALYPPSSSSSPPSTCTYRQRGLPPPVTPRSSMVTSSTRPPRMVMTASAQRPSRSSGCTDSRRLGRSFGTGCSMIWSMGCMSLSKVSRSWSPLPGPRHSPIRRRASRRSDVRVKLVMPSKWNSSTSATSMMRPLGPFTLYFWRRVVSASYELADSSAGLRSSHSLSATSFSPALASPPGACLLASRRRRRCRRRHRALARRKSSSASSSTMRRMRSSVMMCRICSYVRCSPLAAVGAPFVALTASAAPGCAGPAAPSPPAACPSPPCLASSPPPPGLAAGDAVEPVPPAAGPGACDVPPVVAEGAASNVTAEMAAVIHARTPLESHPSSCHAAFTSRRRPRRSCPLALRAAFIRRPMLVAASSGSSSLTSPSPSAALAASRAARRLDISAPSSFSLARRSARRVMAAAMAMRANGLDVRQSFIARQLRWIMVTAPSTTSVPAPYFRLATCSAAQRRISGKIFPRTR